MGLELVGDPLDDELPLPDPDADPLEEPETPVEEPGAPDDPVPESVDPAFPPFPPVSALAFVLEESPDPLVPPALVPVASRLSVR